MATKEEPNSTPYMAFYGNGACPPYTAYFPFASGPPTLPYNWNGQPFMGLYGNATFHCMYPYGYVHPTLKAGAVQYSPRAISTLSTELVKAAPMAETDTKSSLVSGLGQSKGSMDMNTANECDETTKGTSASECGTGGLSDRSEDECTENEFKTATSKVDFAKICANPNSVLEYWSASTPVQLQKQGSTDSELPLSNSQLKFHVQDGIKSDMWSQDDKESKRQRRKLSNRESARHSRLRKHAECEELSTRVDSLIAENTSLRTDLDRLSEECEKLFAENAAIMRSLQGNNAEVISEADERSG